MVKIYRLWHILAIALQHPVILWKRKINNKRIKLYWQSPICHWYVVKLFCLPFLLSDKLFFKIYCQKFLWYAIFCTHTSVNALSVTGTSAANSGVVFHRLIALSTHASSWQAAGQHYSMMTEVHLELQLQAKPFIRSIYRESTHTSCGIVVGRRSMYLL